MSERKPRKPLIEPGSVLPQGTDILSSVLNSYAGKTGQPVPFPTDVVITSQGISTNMEPATSKQDNNTAGQLVDKPAKQQKAPKAKKTTTAKEQAAQMADSPKRLCSYRIPEELDNWMEEYAFRHRHVGLKKQDLVAEAIQLLIVSKALDSTEEDS